MTAELPSNWTRESLGTLSILGPQYGANAAAIDPVSARPRYVRITDIDDAGVLHAKEMKSADLADERAYLLRHGDLLLARSGNTVGKSYVHSDANGPCVFAGYLIRFRLDTSRIHPRFAYYFTKTLAYKAWIAARRRVGGQPNVNGSEYAGLEIPHPIQVSEQARIVELLDQADALRRQRAEADRKLARLRPTLFRHHFGDPQDTSRWQLLTLGEHARIIRGASPRPIDAFLGGSVPWLKIGDATVSNDVYVNQTAEHVTEEGAARSVRVPGGSLVIANSGVSCGFARITRREMCIHDGWLSVSELSPRLRPEYLLAWVNEMTLVLRSLAASGTQPNLNTALIKSLKAPAPPREIQDTFIRAMAGVFAIQKAAAASTAKLETLFQTLLHRAFTGELTARWREAHLREGVQEMARVSRE